MKFIKNTLSNGIRVIISPAPNIESATVTVWVGVGSKHEDIKKIGISHFLEHMVFKGSKKRKTSEAISHAVDAMGGEFNAATGKEWTNFYIRSRSEKMDTSFDVLSDMVLNPLLREEDIEREKGVILEEMAMYEDTPMMKIEDVFEDLIFNNTPLGPDTIGTAETVKSITRDDFLNYRKIHYYPENILITVAGKTTEEEVMGLVDKYFGHLEKTGKPNAEISISKLSKGNPRLKVINKKIEQAHFILGFLGYKKGDKDRYVEAVLSSILGGGMSSRLFLEVREKRGLAYSVHTEPEHYKETGYFGTYAGVDLKKVDEAITVVLEQHYGISNSQFPISKSELNKAKEYLKGHIALALEDTRAVNQFFGDSELVLGRVETIEDVYKGIDKVTIEDVVRVAKNLFVSSKLNLAIIGPYGDKSRFERLL